jgi:regulator of sigma E protease
MTILLFFAVLFVLILVHEWGHFIVAKKTGMRVDEFGIGFPPTLFGYTWRGTRYTLNALPIGGFVKILGEDGTTTQSPDSFGAKSTWAQAAVLIAGVTMNVILAFVLFVFVFTYGVSTVVEEGTRDDAQLVVTSVVPQSPAAQAGIEVGDIIVSYGEGTGALTPSAFREYTKSGARTLSVTITDTTENKTVALEPVKGLIAEDSEVYAVGIGPSHVAVVSEPFFSAVVHGAQATYASLIAITVGLSHFLVDIVQNDADLSQVAGPVGIVGLVGDAAEFGLTSLLLFTAMISLNLAVINMLPIPALDGGRLVFVAIEAITRRPINPVWSMRINTVGFLLLLALMALVTFSDVGKLLR